MIVRGGNARISRTHPLSRFLHRCACGHEQRHTTLGAREFRQKLVVEKGDGLLALDFASGTLILTEAGTKRQASLHLVHCHEEPLLYGELAVYVPRGKIEALQKAHSDGVLDRACAELEGSGIGYTREVLTNFLDAEDKRTAIECLFGDAAARTLGFTPRGLSPWAGLALALHDARRDLAPQLMTSAR